jgi:hypothetical protein
MNCKYAPNGRLFQMNWIGKNRRRIILGFLPEADVRGYFYKVMQILGVRPNLLQKIIKLKLT